MVIKGLNKDYQMYGKIFHSIYDGTLAEDWRAPITFQQLIVLCDADGIVDIIVAYHPPLDALHVPFYRLYTSYNRVRYGRHTTIFEWYKGGINPKVFTNKGEIQILFFQYWKQ